jgi:hypothetical protein
MLCVILILLFGAIDSLTLSAQIVFPISVTVGWTPNLSTDNVTQYTVNLNGLTNITVDPSSCINNECTAKLNLSTASNTITITAVNQWGSASSALNFTVANPGKPGNVKIRVP